jgi:GAF domain-containing protein
VDTLVVPDTKKDKKFSDNPMVTGKPFIRFYAGAPVMSADGEPVGVFCIKDTKPRKFSKQDEEVLMGLAAWAGKELNSAAPKAKKKVVAKKKKRK